MSKIRLSLIHCAVSIICRTAHQHRVHAFGVISPPTMLRRMAQQRLQSSNTGTRTHSSSLHLSKTVADTEATNVTTTTPRYDEKAAKIMRSIFTDNVPLLDVRAEGEFSKGSFPNSINIPILNDDQRHLVGICYKNKGADAAFELGEELVSPFLPQRMQAWKNYTEANPAGYLYCFRGGLRSQTTQQLLKNHTGVEYPLVPGGYKALRQFLLDELEQIQDLPVLMIGGRTGSGKTHLIKHFQDRYVDLEGMAKHRGSAFGALVEKQPNQINFENEMAREFLQRRQSPPGSVEQSMPIVIEEEGRRIGQLSLPMSMHLAMVHKFPVLELDTSMKERVRICTQDYITDMFPLFESEAQGDLNLAHENFRQDKINSLDRIQKKLHGYNEISAQLLEGLDLFQQSQGKDISGFFDFTENMLSYYDKFYDYQMDQRKGEVFFRGDKESIIEWTESEEGRRKLAMYCAAATK